jgi:hypothetical protein
VAALKAAEVARDAFAAVTRAVAEASAETATAEGACEAAAAATAGFVAATADVNALLEAVQDGMLEMNVRVKFCSVASADQLPEVRNV